MPTIELAITEEQLAKWTEDASRHSEKPDLNGWIAWACDLYSEILHGRLHVVVQLDMDRWPKWPA